MNDEKLLENLKTLRVYLAKKHGVAVYTIFKDSDIPALMAVKPQTIAELTNVKGFPAHGERSKKWGRDICSVFNQTAKISDMGGF